MDILKENPVGAVVYTSSGNFIGYVRKAALDGEVYDVTTAAGVLQAFSRGARLFLSPCFGYFDNYHQQQTAQGLSMVHQQMALPMGCSLNEKAGTWVTAENMKLFEDEDDKDRSEYERVIAKAKDNANGQRGARSGILTPGGPKVTA